MDLIFLGNLGVNLEGNLKMNEKEIKNYEKKLLQEKISSDSESFQPQYHQIKKLGLKINRSKLTTGNWSLYENEVYLQFVLQNKEDFLTEQSRRKCKVFYRLSKILRKRTPDQCRSHHQKLQLRFDDKLDSIIAEVTRKVHKGKAQQYVQQQQELLKEKMNGLAVAKTGEVEIIEARMPKAILSTDWYSISEIKSNHVRIDIASSNICFWRFQ